MSLIKVPPVDALPCPDDSGAADHILGMASAPVAEERPADSDVEVTDE